ncbi:MAG: glycosyltransferase family 4 protein [Anaerolineales bacterium]|nr:glycosyltransferase family 4 protein [Anaerolineales bacterium]
MNSMQSLSSAIRLRGLSGALKRGPMHSRINRELFRRDMQAFLRSNDVVFFEFASELLVAASHLPKTCGIVTRLHRYEMYQWVDRVNWDVVDRVILVSKAKQREFITRFPNHAEKTFVTSPSTSLERFQFCDKPFAGDIGILCHLTPRKRVYDLILLFADLLPHEPGLRLHIAGGRHVAYPDYDEALHYIVDRLGIRDNVIFYGNLKDPSTWYQQIDLFVSNSYSEGLQVAPMEAMATGAYALSHGWDGADELVPPENLFLTPAEFQQKVLAYCALPEAEKQAARRQMRAWASEHFDIRKTINDICAVVDEVAVARTRL